MIAPVADSVDASRPCAPSEIGRDGDLLVVVRADLERDGAGAAVEQLDAVELGGRADALDLRLASWLTSAVIAALSDVDSVPFLYCTASSRTRCSIEWTSFSEPSAVWTSETPSCALRWAWARPRIWPRSFSLMARPAASSAARLMR